MEQGRIIVPAQFCAVITIFEESQRIFSFCGFSRNRFMSPRL